MADIVMELAGVPRDVAEDALYKYKDVVSAIDALLLKPTVSGDKFIPEKPVVNTGMTAEQTELCLRGRDLQDKVNALFSVAHSQTQTPQAQLVLSNEEVPVPTVAVADVPVLSPESG